MLCFTSCSCAVLCSTAMWQRNEPCCEPVAVLHCVHTRYQSCTVLTLHCQSNDVLHWSCAVAHKGLCSSSPL